MSQCRVMWWSFVYVPLEKAKNWNGHWKSDCCFYYYETTSGPSAGSGQAVTCYMANSLANNLVLLLSFLSTKYQQLFKWYPCFFLVCLKRLLSMLMPELPTQPANYPLCFLITQVHTITGFYFCADRIEGNYLYRCCIFSLAMTQIFAINVVTAVFFDHCSEICLKLYSISLPQNFSDNIRLENQQLVF